MSKSNEVIEVEAIIAFMAPAAQRRVQVTAQILRDLLAKDDTGESLIAFTLVMAEVAGE